MGKDFNGHVTTYAYEPTTGRLATRTPDASFTREQPVSWTYYTSGRRHTMSDATGTTSYAYDSRDRLLQKRTQEGTLAYTYDAAGNRQTVRSDSGAYAVDYGYDSLNRLHTVTDRNPAAGANGLVATYHYDAGGRLGSYDYPNGVSTTMGYDTLNRVQNVSLATVGTTPTTLASYAYTFYATGNRHTVAELSGRSVTWGYDGLWRLTGETITGSGSAGAVGYSYDAVGNRLSRASTVPGLSPQGSTYDLDDRLNADRYDSDGNTVASGGNAYGYDSENRLLSLNTTAAGYLYDGDGQLVSKTAAGATTTYLIDDQTPAGYTQIAEERVGGVVAKTYVFGPQRIAMRAAGAVSYYGYDAHSGVRVLLDEGGAVTDTYEYDAFGNGVGSTGTTANSFMYRGEQVDATLGLHYLRARWLDSGRGKFHTLDYCNDSSGIDPRQNHLYAYARSSPIDLDDPSGCRGILANLIWGQKVHRILGEKFVEDAPADEFRFPDYSINNLLIADGQPTILSGGLFRPDLTSFKKRAPLGEVYEIKPQSWYGLVSGEAQLAGYLYLLNTNDKARSFLPGSSWIPPDKVDLGGGITAQVEGPVAGVIYYWVRDDAMDKALTLTAAVGSLLVGTLDPSSVLAGGLGF